MQPDGGPKDSLRPFVKNSIPKNQSTQFKGQKVIIEFNEWVREKNIRQELLITPPNTKYTHKIIKNRVEIIFEEPLNENTTYSLNFREAIEDITEGNKALIDTLSRIPLKIAFSTGEVIDSMKIAGEVKNRLSNKLLEKATIALYRTDDTLQIDEDAPYYYTITDKEGKFRLENIKAGEYKVYAFLDKNGNNKYDESEAIDFYAQATRLSADSADLRGLVFKIAPEDHTAPKIESKSNSDTGYEVLFDEGLQQLDIKLINDTELTKLYYQLKNKGKTIEFYNPQSFYDSIRVELKTKDSVNNLSQHEISFAFKKPEEERRNRNRKDKGISSSALGFDIKSAGGTGFEKDFELSIEFEKPVKQSYFEKLTYIPDDDSSRISILLTRDSTRFYEWNNTQTELKIKYPRFPFNKKIRILADTAAFISILDDSSKAFSKVIERKDIGDFSSIYGQISTQEANYILQLLDEKGSILSQRINPIKYDFNYLRPGTYQLRIIIDTNQNGKWDASDWLNNVPAEEIIFPSIPNEGKLRERWDIEALIEF